MSTKQTLFTNLKGIVADASGYTSLTHAINLEKNKFSSGGRYAVRPLGSTEVEGSTKRVTHDHRFSIVLINSYITDNLNDDSIIDKQLELDEKFEDIYRQCMNTKVGAPDTVMTITNLDISDPVIVSEEKLVVIEGTLIVRAKFNL